MESRPHILAVATAVPAHELDQRAVAAQARAMFPARGSEIDRLMPVFENSGIRKRYSCVPLDWYLAPTSWKAKNDLYLENAVMLIEDAAQRCLATAGVGPEAVDTIVAVSTSGLATPSLDARLMNRMGFRRTVQRLPIFGLGCAGGVLGLARAGAMARAAPGSLVLLLVVELCGITFRAGDHSKSNIIAAALFGDGAAAVLLTCEAVDGHPEIEAWGEITWPESLDVMGWRVEDDGLGVLFSRDIPSIVRERFGGEAAAFLAARGLSFDDLDGTICHPGGAKVVDALEAVFGQAPGSMAEARSVLREYGNMSAATVLFVLERVLRKAPRGRYLISSLGPGFTAGFVLMQAA